jgi:hypothetical protein
MQPNDAQGPAPEKGPAPEQDPNTEQLPKTEPPPKTGQGAEPKPGTKSFGNMGPDHWSRARAGANAEALDYYRQRSQAAGVREGGGARNHYCMDCDGVIPFEHQGDACPHCGATQTGDSRRYFNWVEIDRPPPSDLRALLPVVGLGALGLTLVVLALVWWLA